jgi:hypothetical protein
VRLLMLSTKLDAAFSVSIMVTVNEAFEGAVGLLRDKDVNLSVILMNVSPVNEESSFSVLRIPISTLYSICGFFRKPTYRFCLATPFCNGDC